MKEIRKYLKKRQNLLTDCENAINRIYSKIATIVRMVDESEVITQWPEPFENLVLAEVVEDCPELEPLASVRLYCEYTLWEPQVQTPVATWGKPLLQLRRSCNTPYLAGIRLAILAAEKQIEMGLLKSLERKANYPLEEK